MLAILIWLGTWQYQRLQWKTALISEIEASVMGEPLTSLEQIVANVDKDEPVDFRRVQINAQHVPFETPLRVFTAENMDVSWRLFSPIQENGVTAFGGFEVIADKLDPVAKMTGSVDIAGYVRLARAQNIPKVDSSPDQNRWFGFNPKSDTHDWSALVDGGADTRFYLDVVVGVTDASSLPPRRPEIRNHHFDYMLTWYGLAIVLLIIYVIMHKREGRFSAREILRE